MKSAGEILAFSRTVDGQGTEDHQNCTCTSIELTALITYARMLPQRARVVEIGVYTGRSASVWLQLQPELDLDIHLIDNWSWHPHHAAPYFAKLVVDHFLDVPFTLYKGLSADVARHWTQPIDFLYIDGWHDEPGIKADCAGWIPHVVSGGIVAFHDSQHEPIAKCIREYCGNAFWEPLAKAERMTVWRRP